MHACCRLVTELAKALRPIRSCLFRSRLLPLFFLRGCSSTREASMIPLHFVCCESWLRKRQKTMTKPRPTPTGTPFGTFSVSTLTFETKPQGCMRVSEEGFESLGGGWKSHTVWSPPPLGCFTRRQATKLQRFHSTIFFMVLL